MLHFVLTAISIALGIGFITILYFKTKGKKTITIFDISNGRHCFNCGDRLLSDDGWLNVILSGGGSTYFKKDPQMCLCCKREHKLSILSNRWSFDKISFKRALLLYDKQITISIVTLYAIFITIEISSLFLGFKIESFTIFVDMYVIFYWIFWISKNKMFTFVEKN